MRKMIAVLAAGALILGGAAVAFAQTDEGETTSTHRSERGGHISGVLDDLVENGTISQDQADAIVAALEAKRDELHAAREELRVERDEARAALTEAWSDGVLTEDEAADLPFGDRLTDPDGPFAEAWSDGQLTRAEFDEIRAELAPHRGFRGRGHHGSGVDAPAESDTALDA